MIIMKSAPIPIQIISKNEDKYLLKIFKLKQRC